MIVRIEAVGGLRTCATEALAASFTKKTFHNNLRLRSTMDVTKYKSVKHKHEPGDYHELTFSCYSNKALLIPDSFRRLLSQHIDQACKELLFHLVAFVYMPDHVHLLVHPQLPSPEIERFLCRLKQPFSRGIKKQLKQTVSPLLQELTIRERPGKLCFRFWQEGPGYDRNIRSPKALQGSIDYIHMNPVRRGLCDRAIDWPWSSARYYLLDPPRQQFPDLPFIHGLPLDAFQ